MITVLCRELPSFLKNCNSKYCIIYRLHNFFKRGTFIIITQIVKLEPFPWHNKSAQVVVNPVTMNMLPCRTKAFSRTCSVSYLSVSLIPRCPQTPSLSSYMFAFVLHTNQTNTSVCHPIFFFTLTTELFERLVNICLIPQLQHLFIHSFLPPFPRTLRNSVVLISLFCHISRFQASDPELIV